MNRFLMIDETTGSIHTVITETDPAIAALYATHEDAPAGSVVMTITSDTGAHIQDDAVTVDLETGGIVAISDGEPIPALDGSVTEQVVLDE